MEPNKKRRNSILKKTPFNEEDTTVDVTTKIKRRISFSGKKSVKEFIAGEEEATIWGTSYEESADGLHSNSAENGLVNVHEKRIVLRNRRVIVEVKSEAKRRLKKKVNVAENDKENICIQQPEVEPEIELKPVIQLEQPKQVKVVTELESAPKSELDQVEIQVNNAKTEYPSKTLDRLNICSNTFDFINYSGPINKSLTIEQSVDVTLDENELQMFKFRIPVTATDVSPNWSLSSFSDGSSPIHFSRSIMMSEEDLKMLNIMREKKGLKSLKVAQITNVVGDENNTKGKTNPQVEMNVEQTIKERDAILMDLTEMEVNKVGKKMRPTMHINQSMSVSQCEVPNALAKGAKRKTIIKIVDMEANNAINEGDRTLEGGVMNLVGSHGPKTDTKKRATMHMNQSMNVSYCGVVEAKQLKRKTMTRSVVMEQDSVLMDAAHLNNTNASSMDINSPLRKKAMHNATSKSMDITNITVADICQAEPITRQTIYFDTSAVDESLVCNPTDQVSVQHMDASCPPVANEMELSVYAAIENELKNLGPSNALTKMNETNPNFPIPEEQHTNRNRQTINLAEDGQMDATLDKTNHAHADMIEDSPTAIKPALAEFDEDCPKANKSVHGTKANSGSCQTTLVPVKVLDETASRIKDSKVKKRESIYTPTDIIEDSPRRIEAPKSNVLNHETIRTDTEVTENILNAQHPSESGAGFKIKIKQRQSTYTPIDIIEGSPKPTKAKALSRQTIYSSIDIMEEAIVPIQPEFLASKLSAKKRESIYTPTDIIEDSPKATRTIEAAEANVHHPQLSDDFSQSTVSAPKHSRKQKHSVHTPFDIIDDSPKALQPCVVAQITEPPPTQFAVPAPKVFVKLMTLQKGPIPDQDALRNQKIHQPQVESNKDQSSMDMSTVHDLSMSSIGMNFHQLNEELFRRETKASTDEQKETSKQSHRKTLHLNTEIDLDATSSPLEEAVSQTQKQMIYFDRENQSTNLPPENSMDLSLADVSKCQQTSHSSRDSAVIQKNRQTIHFNQNNELNESQVDKPKSSIIARDAQLLNNDSTMDLSMQEVHQSSKLNYEQIKLGHAARIRRTVFYDQNLEESPTIIASTAAAINPTNQSDGQVNQSKRQTIADHYALDIDESRIDFPASEVLNQPRRQTMNYNQDIELDDNNSDDLSMTGIVKKPQDANIECINGNLILPQTSKASYRRTIFFNQDLVVDDIDQPPPSRSSLHRNQILEKDIINSMTSTTSKRQTLHFNEDIESDEEDARQMTLKSLSFETERNTIENVQRHPLNEEPKFVAKSNRETIYFHRNNNLEESAQAPQEDSAMNLSIAEEHILHEEISKALPKPKRLTILDNKPVDLDESPQKFTARKSSFSRTLKFNAICIATSQVQGQTWDMYPREQKVVKPGKDDSPLYFSNEKSLSTATTSEINRSLAEYLKAEAAASKFLSNSQDMSIEVAEAEQNCGKSVYFDAEDEVVAEQQHQTSHEPHNVFEESGMQPLQPFAIKRHTTFGSDDMEEEPFNQSHSPIEEANTAVRDNAGRLKETLLNIKANSINFQTFDEKSEEQNKFIRQKPFGAREMVKEPRADLQSALQSQDFESLRRREVSSYKDASHVMEDIPVNIGSNRSNLQTSDILRHAYLGRGQTRRQTLMEPEPMMEECENSTKKSAKLNENLPQVNRKTIHFNNENAVDESFFDENQSKPATSQKLKSRQTLFFNESKHPSSDMDITHALQSRTVTKSKAAQGMKEILLESEMLFSESKLPMPSTPRSSAYFGRRDNSMDITTADENMEYESPKCNVVPECTPSKCRLSKSRIPQLIDVTGKFTPIRKSMVFKQKELPNFGCYTQTETLKHQPETPNADETSETPPQKLQESFSDVEVAVLKPRRLQESFDTVEIPRSVTAPEAKQLQESFETVEIPRRVTTFNQQQLQESFDTVEIPRRATTFQKNDTLYLCPNEDKVAETTNISQMSFFKFEDAPITISDVSTFFAQKQTPTSKQAIETQPHNTTEALTDLDGNRFTMDDQLPKSSDSEDTVSNFDKFKKRYVELTCDSIMLSDFGEDIEKTHLSLVNTLDEESECPQQSHVVDVLAPELSNVVVEALKVATEVCRPTETTLKTISSVCRKCKRHRLSETQNETTIGSFMLEPLPIYKMDLAALEELGSKPKISDVAKVWRQKMRESDSFNISDGSHDNVSDVDDVLEEFIAALDKERLIAAQLRERKQIKMETSFVHTVRTKMQSKKSNWILNELLLTSGVLKFTHTRIRTFAIFISFTATDPRGIKVNFNDIQLVPNVLHTRQWTAFDYALHYQLLVELPFDLRKICPTSEQLFQLLEHVEIVTQDVLKTGKDMWYLILTSPASLIREPSGRLYIQKFVRTKTLQNEVKRTEFQIEVRNMKKLSYESIAVPPLYEFDEKVQLLPTGQNFLRIFLADPIRYIKA